MQHHPNFHWFLLYYTFWLKVMAPCTSVGGFKIESVKKNKFCDVDTSAHYETNTRFLSETRWIHLGITQKVMLVQTQTIYCMCRSIPQQWSRKGKARKLKFHSNNIIRLQPSKCDSSSSEEMTILKSLYKASSSFLPAIMHTVGEAPYVYYKIMRELGISGVQKRGV